MMDRDEARIDRIPLHPNHLLTPEAAGAFLGGDRPISTATLADWRCKGIGPRALKVGRLIRYRMADLEAWLESRVQRGR